MHDGEQTPETTGAQTEQRQIFDLEGAAGYLGVGLNTMGDLIKQGKVRHVHIGRLIRIHRQALDECTLESHSHDPAKVLAQHGITIPDGLRVVGSRQRRQIQGVRKGGD